MPASARSIKWNKRLNEGHWFKRGFWRVVYGLGRVFFRKWNPLEKVVVDATQNKPIIPNITKIKFKVGLRDLSLLEKLPQETVQEEVAPNLDKKDLSNIVQASKTTYKMFQKPLQAAKLLHYVQEANYDKVKEMIDVEPSLMFQYVSYKKADGSYETISPLKFAFKMLDTYMWKMFYEKIKNDSECMKNPKLLERFTKQANAQAEHVDLEPLFAAYRTYDKKLLSWEEEKISDQELDEAWLNVGKMQREILPRHMLKEFCRKGNSWSNWRYGKSKFDVNVEPRPADPMIYYSNTKQEETLLQFIPNSGLGFDFTLIRGELGAVGSGVGIWRRGIVRGWGRPKVFGREKDVFDLATFDNLYEVRTNDLATLRSQLEMAMGNTKKQLLMPRL